MVRKGSKHGCVTKRCRNSVKNAGAKCSTCRRRDQKNNNPFAYYWGNMKQNAKRRGKEFRITLEEYVEWSVKHRLHTHDGTKFCNKTVDRVDNSLGYFIENMQVLTLSENSRKRFIDERLARQCISEDEYESYLSEMLEFRNEVRARVEAETAVQMSGVPF